MELNEIKKALYKQKPTATLVNISKNGLLYTCSIYEDKFISIDLLIPLTDLGDATFNNKMDAKLLIRWII